MPRGLGQLRAVYGTGAVLRRGQDNIRGGHKRVEAAKRRGRHIRGPPECGILFSKATSFDETGSEYIESATGHENGRGKDARVVGRWWL